MELHALGGERAVAHSHDLSVGRVSRHDKVFRKLLFGNRKRVVAPRVEWIGQSLEERPPVVVDGRCFAVHECLCLVDTPAQCVGDRLMPEAYA